MDNSHIVAYLRANIHFPLRYKFTTEFIWPSTQQHSMLALTEMFKMVKGTSATPVETTFFTNNVRTRRHPYKLIKRYSKGDIRHYFFSESCKLLELTLGRRGELDLVEHLQKTSDGKMRVSFYIFRRSHCESANGNRKYDTPRSFPLSLLLLQLATQHKTMIL